MIFVETIVRIYATRTSLCMVRSVPGQTTAHVLNISGFDVIVLSHIDDYNSMLTPDIVFRVDPQQYCDL